MNRPGILLVGTFSSDAGAHRTYCEDLADRLESRAWKVIRTSKRLARLPRIGDMLATAWLRRHDYEIAHIDVFSGHAFVWAEAVAFELRRLRKPYVLTLRGGSLPDFSRRWAWRARNLLSTAATVTAPSPYLQTEMASYARHVTVIPNAIDIARYSYRARTQVRPRLVWLRAFHAVYNPVMAVEVLARVASKRADAELTMIGADKGDGSLDEVRQRAADLGIMDRLRIIPGVPKSEVPRYLDAADIFLNTTNADNTPISVLEAMACGLCVVTTSVGGIPYLIEDGRHALLVSPGDPDAMADHVLRLLADRQEATALSQRARGRANENDWTRVLDRWEHLFETAIERGDSQ